MDNIDNIVLTKEMIATLRELRELQNSGRQFSADEVKNPLTNVYSENLAEPVTYEVNGEKIAGCRLTNFGEEVLKYLDEKGK